MELIAFLVENHLYMPSIAQTRDLSDENLIIGFAQKMKDGDSLRMLYILTFADMKASRAEAFNSWKNTLFQELYIRAFHIIEKGDFTMTDTACKLDKIKNEVISELRLKMPMDDIHYNLDLTPSRYLLNNSPEIISNHILLCYNLEEKTLAFDVRQKPDKGYYDILIATPDSHGLFYKVCGVMVYHNMNILDAQIDTRSDGIAMDILRVNHTNGDEYVDQEEWKAIQDDLEKVIDGRVRVEELVKKKGAYLHSKKKGLKETETTIKIDNDTSDFYTVIDIEANDRFGLLYSITKAMSDMGVYIYIAKITTRLMRVTDSFYVRDIFGQKIYDEKEVERVKRSLSWDLETFEKPRRGF
jgi:[protein-PII] uridylyltransferase